jgi:hypothetical protein
VSAEKEIGLCSPRSLMIDLRQFSVNAIRALQRCFAVRDYLRTLSVSRSFALTWSFAILNA